MPATTFVNADPHPWPYNGDLRSANTALVVIDMQTGLCGVGGYVDKIGYDLSLSRALIAPIAVVMGCQRELGFCIVDTREGHRPDLSDLPACQQTAALAPRRAASPGPGGGRSTGRRSMPKAAISRQR